MKNIYLILKKKPQIKQILKKIKSQTGNKKRIIEILEKKFKIILKIYISQITDQKKYL